MKRLVGAVAILLLLGSHGALATADVTVSRIQGGDRYETAAAIAIESFEGEKVTRAVIARGDAFADALAGNLIARNGGSGVGPILLTPSEYLHPETRRALQTLQPDFVEIIGGEAAITPAVEEELRAAGTWDVGRTSGDDRYETAAWANHPTMFEESGTYLEPIIIASGEDFPDALAAGPLAFARAMPLMLTRRDELPEATRENLINGSAEKVFLIGGADVVSDKVKREIEDSCGGFPLPEADCIEVVRVAGQTRTETAMRVAELFVRETGSDLSHVTLTRGDNFPDAIAAGPHGGHELAPLLLTASPTELTESTRAFLAQNAGSIRSIHVLGDETAVSRSVAEEARRAAGGA